MIHRIEIREKSQFFDPHAASISAQARELGIDSIESVHSARLFFVQGDLDAAQLTELADHLLADAVTERFVVGSEEVSGTAAVVEVHLKPGVMDPVAASAEKAAKDMGFDVQAVTTARRYEFFGQLSPDQTELLTRRLLANTVIEDVYYDAHTPDEHTASNYELNVQTVAIRDLSDDELVEMAEKGDLFLNLTEMKAIQDYFRGLDRDPIDVELEMIAQTWSEHCVHKTFRSDVEVCDGEGNVIENIPNLIKTTIFSSTVELNKPWCLSIFEDNAGVIEFDDKWALAFKVETHNHPSALDPYGGASTGIGGVVRDPMGTGLGSKPVANTDVFCFGDISMPLEDVPAGLLHPKRVMRGVVGGVRDYGNRMGIPTVNGAIYFDDRYIGNPLVFCGTLGLIPRDMANKRSPGPGDAIVVVGGRTGRDGIHGATFSSGEMTHAHETEFSNAVQIGNAITEKKVLDCLMQARDAGLFSAITDCGAGGLSSAIGEMGEKIGACVHLDKAPLKYSGLSYDEIWISEAQERMVLSVPEEKVSKVLDLFAAEDVEATVVGHFGTDGGKLKLFYGQTQVADLDMDFLHDGLPRPTKKAIWDFKPVESPVPPRREDYTDTLMKILSSPNVASKEHVIRQYDHEVQGGSVVKPLVGVNQAGPADAAVIRPVLGSYKAAALGCGMNPYFGDLDPYQSALHAVDEALRNIVAVGGNIERTAILDNFCWGNCNKPDRMGSFVQSAKACREAALTYSTPFVSGKDSLNNEFQTADGDTIKIPGTLLISAVSVVDDARKCVTSDLKQSGNSVFIIGQTGPQLGGSHLLMVEGLESGNDVPPVDPATNLKTMKALQQAISDGLVKSCHDLSEGGLAVAAAEMCFAGGLGMDLSLARMPITRDGFDAEKKVPTLAQLFGESAGRFLVEVAEADVKKFREIFAKSSCGLLGTVSDNACLKIRSLDGKSALIEADIAELKKAWDAKG